MEKDNQLIKISDEQHLIFVNFFMKMKGILSKVGIWPSRSVSVISIVMLCINFVFLIMAIIKNTRNPKNKAAADAFTHVNASTLTIFYLIWILYHKEDFLKLMNEINADLKRKHFNREEKLQTFLYGLELRKDIKIGAAIVSLSTVGKLLEPLFQFSYLKLTKSDVRFELPPAMATPDFIYGPLRHIIEIFFRLLVMGPLYCIIFEYMLVCLYLESQLRGLYNTILHNKTPFHDVSDSKSLDFCIARHTFLLEITQLAKTIFASYIFLNNLISTVNICFVLFATALHFSIDVVVSELSFLTAGISQLLVLHWFSDRILEANHDIANAAFYSNWIGKKVLYQKKINFIIRRSQKMETMKFMGFTPSLKSFLNIVSSAYGYFNILYRMFNERQ